MLPVEPSHTGLPPTLIKMVTVEPLYLPLYEPFVISTGQFSAAQNVLVRVELENGIIGMGEASPSLSSGGETATTIQAAANEMGTQLIGRNAQHWRVLAEFLLANYEAQSCARAAIEMALLDALTRSYGIPLYVWFGGASSSIETDLTVPIVTAEHANELARSIVSRGIRTIKIKVGEELEADVARVVAVHDAAPHCRIMLDGNQGYDVHGALRLLQRLEKRDIHPVLFEQPVHRLDWDGLAMLSARAGVPIAADESVHSTGDALRLIKMNAVQVINIKLMKSTLLGAIDIVALCRAAHVGLMIGAMMESRLSTSVAAHFVAGMGGFDFVDLDTPMLINGDPFHGGYTQTGGRYDLSATTAGHGVDRW